MDLGLAGKRAIVTGGTRGIGRAIAEGLAREGCAVAICARHEPAVNEAVASLQRHGHIVTGRALDVGDGPALRQWVAEAGEALGGIDVLVSNVSALAGVPGEDGWRRYFEVDLLGTVRSVEAAQPRLAQSDAASIVVVGSIAAIETGHDVFPDGFLQAYGAIKAALLNYVAEIARTLGPAGIRANTVTPGPTYFPGSVWDRREREGNPMYAKAIARARLQHKLGTGQDVANAVVFLASPAAGHISGANLVVDGAFTRRVH